jgi:hypothetical protein
LQQPADGSRSLLLRGQCDHVTRSELALPIGASRSRGRARRRAGRDCRFGAPAATADLLRVSRFTARELALRDVARASSGLRFATNALASAQPTGRLDSPQIRAHRPRRQLGVRMAIRRLCFRLDRSARLACAPAWNGRRRPRLRSSVPRAPSAPLLARDSSGERHRPRQTKAAAAEHSARPSVPVRSAGSSRCWIAPIGAARWPSGRRPVFRQRGSRSTSTPDCRCSSQAQALASRSLSWWTESLERLWPDRLRGLFRPAKGASRRTRRRPLSLVV